MKKELSIRTGKPGRPQQVRTAARKIIGEAGYDGLIAAGFVIIPASMLDDLAGFNVSPAEHVTEQIGRDQDDPPLFTGNVTRKDWTEPEQPAPAPALTTKPAQPVGKEEGA